MPPNRDEDVGFGLGALGEVLWLTVCCVPLKTEKKPIDGGSFGGGGLGMGSPAFALSWPDTIGVDCVWALDPENIEKIPFP